MVFEKQIFMDTMIDNLDTPYLGVQIENRTYPYLSRNFRLWQFQSSGKKFKRYPVDRERARQGHGGPIWQDFIHS